MAPWGHVENNFPFWRPLFAAARVGERLTYSNMRAFRRLGGDKNRLAKFRILFSPYPPKKTRLNGSALCFWFWELPGFGFLLLVFGLTQTVFRFFRLRGRHFLTPDSAMPVVVMLGGVAG
jgi:hypothetical protein